jgi:2Fe-2S ferredoxin
MPVITFIERDGSVRKIDIRTGFTVMEAAVMNNVRGIDADCRGSCACGTCHVHVNSSWSEKVGEPRDLEQDMLSMIDKVDPNVSRLCCQIRITNDLDGLVVTIP